MGATEIANKFFVYKMQSFVSGEQKPEMGATEIANKFFIIKWNILYQEHRNGGYEF